LEFDKEIGVAKAYQALGKMKSNGDASHLLVRMIIAIAIAITIASSDGNFDANEQRVVGKIARELGLTPAEFELP
jgi:tellurite resistance protein TerB